MARLLTPARIFAVGEHLPAPLSRGIAVVAGEIAGRMPLPGLEQWRDNVAATVGARMGASDTRLLTRHWAQNNLWSMSLGSWSPDDVLGRAVAPGVAESLHASLRGPGLVLALPHMGSWDFAGAWSARHGIGVVSVAERLPRGLYEKFRDARARMGITIHPIDEPHLVERLTQHVRAGAMVCLLADRDLSRNGVEVRWPTGLRTLVPPGPALIAARAGADLRVATAAFCGRGLRLSVTEPVDQTGGAGETMQRVTDHFAAAIADNPTNWLCLQPLRRTPRR